MPLSENAFPYESEDGRILVHDGDQDYEVDANGQVITPDGPEVPWWGSPTPQAPAQPTPPAVPPARPQPPGLPPLNIQPGMSAQQWEANYNLAVGEARRLREILESIDQPKARALIDQVINEMDMGRYAAQVGARESQFKMTGRIPQWLPQIPQAQQGAWRNYQVGGLVAPPGGAGGTPTTGMTEEQAAQAIWNGDPQLQSLYKANHPEMSPVMAVQDWWTWAPREGATTLSDYARKKGYLNA